MANRSFVAKTIFFCFVCKSVVIIDSYLRLHPKPMHQVSITFIFALCRYGFVGAYIAQMRCGFALFLSFVQMRVISATKVGNSDSNSA